MSLLILLALRFMWQKNPGLPFALVFWGTALVMDLMEPQSFGSIVSHAGALSNMIVVLANEGYMPVVGDRHGSMFSVWKAADEDSKLLFLADQTKWRGMSIGDFLIFGGIAISIIVDLVKSL